MLRIGFAFHGHRKKNYQKISILRINALGNYVHLFSNSCHSCHQKYHGRKSQSFDKQHHMGGAREMQQ